MADVQKILETGTEVLDLAKSVVRLLGPVRSAHPDWPSLQSSARQRLSAEDRSAVDKMDAAVRKARGAERWRIWRLEADALRRGQFYVHPRGVILRRLAARKLVSLQGKGEQTTVSVHASPEELIAAAEKVIERGRVSYERARKQAIECELLSGPVLREAEAAAVQSWLRERRKRLADLLPALHEFARRERLRLAGLSPVGVKKLVRWKGASEFAIVLQISTELLSGLEKESLPTTLIRDLWKLDWEELQCALESELGNLARSQGQPKVATSPTGAVDRAFREIIRRAAPQQLSFKEIFRRAKEDKQNGNLFQTGRMNKDHEKRIRKLIGAQTGDGYIIKATESRKGLRRLFWAEPAAENEHDEAP